jgi:hypothetical protein
MSLFDSERKKPIIEPPKTAVSAPRMEGEDSDVNPAIRRIFGFLPGIILILLGVLFLLSKHGYLAGEWWQYFLVGMAVIVFLEISLRLRVNRHRRLDAARLISALLLIIGGALFLFDPNDWWPWVLIGAGVVSIVLFIWSS